MSFAWAACPISRGYDQAQFSLGVLYDKGQGVQQDYVEAVTAHSKAAPSTIPAA